MQKLDKLKFDSCSIKISPKKPRHKNILWLYESNSTNENDPQHALLNQLTNHGQIYF